MPKTKQGMSNYKYGICLDIDGNTLTDEKFIPGSRTTIEYPFAAAGVGQVIYTAPYPCKVIRAIERHGTVAGQAGTITVEKVGNGVACGSGTVAMASTIDAAGTINTNQTISALTTSAAVLAVGDSLALKVASGAVTSLAGANIVIVIEYI